MRKLAQRLGALAPSITVGLVLFSVALTALLAFRAFEASRAQRQLTENTLRDYAGFAAFQLMNTAYSRIAGQHRLVFDLILRPADARGPAPPLGAARAAEIMRTRGELCRCLDSVGFFYQVTFADRGITAAPGDIAVPAPEVLASLRDTIIAQAEAAYRRPAQAAATNAAGRRMAAPPPAFFTAIFTEHAGRPYALVHAFALGGPDSPAVAYGYAMPAEHFIGRQVMAILRGQPILPGSLTRGLRADSILAVTVRDPLDRVVFSSARDVSTQFAASDSLDDRLGRVRFEVAIDPAAAGRLIIGGLPESRLPEVIATALVSVLLLGLLLHQFRRQEELSRLRDEFVSGVSHELRTPLAQIRLLAELFRLGKVPTDAQKERSLRIIDQEARRLSFLVDSILNFTRSQKDRGERTLAPVRTDIVAEVDEIVAGFEPLAQAQGSQVRAQLEAGIVADVDRSALRQILLNLLDNAVRYGPRGQTVTVRATSSPADGTWTLEVADEGPGVPPDERTRIFDPYYRMPRHTGGAVGGTGIGLAVVHRLVHAHGGRVHVASHLVAANGDAVGARFVVSLPIDAAGGDA